jgi:hypothetical protein
MTGESVTSASPWRNALARLFANRVRLHELPLGPRWLARVALVVAFSVAALLMLTPLNLPLPGGTITMLRSDNPTINRVVLAVVMIAFAIGLAAIAFAAGTGAIRHWRLVVTGVAVVGLATIPADPIGIGPPWAVPIMLIGLASGFALLVLVAVGFPRRPWVLPLLAGIPPLVGLSMVLTAGMFEVPEGYPAAFFESYELTPIMVRLAATEAMFIVLGAWAAIEYGRGLAVGSAKSARLRASWWILLPLFLAVKSAWVLLASFGWLPKVLIPSPTAAHVLFQEESWLSLLQAALFTGFIAWWLLRRRTSPSSDGSIPAVLLVAVPLVGAFILPQVGLAVDGFISNFGDRLTLIPRDPNAGVDAFARSLGDIQDVLLAAAPAIAAYFAAVAGLWSLLRRRFTGGTLFLLAFAAWTIIPATTWMFRTGFGVSGLFEGPAVGDGSEAILGQVHPISLDLAITALVLVLTIAWWAKWQQVVRPPELLAVLLLSTVVAYGGGVAGGFGVLLFWIGLGFPIFAQFAFDARALNEKRPGREGRVLAGLGMALLIAASTLSLIALGFVGPEHPGFEAFAKRLLVVPLVAVLAATAIFTQRAHHGGVNA